MQKLHQPENDGRAWPNIKAGISRQRDVPGDGEIREIDGEPYVMEMLQKQDSQNFIDEDGCKKLIGSLMKYNHMVYMDALTGVYNRRYFEDEIKIRPTQRESL